MHKTPSNRAYDTGKYIAQIAMPAVATFYGTVGSLWGFANVTEVVGTITAADTLLGALLVLSAIQYNKQDKVAPEEPLEGE